jgi:type I restriction enzyme S subunit
MNNNWPRVKLGEVLTHRKEFITIDDLTTYKRPRVQLHAQGIVLRDEITGALIKTKEQQICREGEFLVAEIDAKVGGFGIVPNSLDGSIVSSHYFLFRINQAKLDKTFLDFFIRTPAFREQVEAQGSTNYAAIRPSHVLSYEISLPPLAEQRRIVARIEELASKVEEARDLRQQAMEETRTFYRHISAALFPEPAGSVVGDFIRFQTGYAFQSEWFSDVGIRLARNVNIGHGMIDWSETARIPEERRMEFLRFELKLGDILVSLDRPIISTGVKVARVEEQDLPCLLLQRVARARFQADNVLPDYFCQWLQSPHFVNAIDPGRSNGVPHISHKDIERIPFTPPSLTEQHRILTKLSELQSEFGGLKRAQAETGVELNALVPSILNIAFRGEL